MTVTYHAEWAWVGGEVRAEVAIEVRDGRFTSVTVSDPNQPSCTTGARQWSGKDVRLHGLSLPGFANAHSHAFHRALRGRAQTAGGSFWTWREQMYALAARLTPDTLYALARAVYAEMALAGFTAVGEFHYLHHDRYGKPYQDPNTMGYALVTAARDAGLRITLLDTLYLASGVDGTALDGVQRRFGDRDLDGWSARVEPLRSLDGHARFGAALHSVRAVPAAVLPAFAARTVGLPVHVHLSEQPAENEQTLAAYGCTPAELLRRTGILGPDTTAVHATHLSDADVEVLGGSGTGVCLCPTTERDLADGIGPGRALADAGSPLSLGTDGHAVIDPFEEARAVELNERLVTGRRGRFGPAELVAAAANHRALGWPDAGEIRAGNRADLVTVRLDGVRTAGTGPDGAIFAATAADVTHVVADGELIVADGRHRGIDVAAELIRAIPA